MLSALAAVSDRLGLVGTVDTTINQPFAVARQLATLDHLSDGRSGWHVAIASGAEGYPRAAEFITVARAFWDSWETGAVPADEQTGVYADPGGIHAVEHRGAQFDVRGFATLPAGPQGHPVLLLEGDSAEGQELGAKYADVLVTPHSAPDASRRYYAAAKVRAAVHGRDPDRLKVFQSSQFVGTPAQVAAEMDQHVQSDVCDGFILDPYLTPHGLDEFVDAVVPLLQERGVFRTEYEGTTIREHLGLGASRVR
jgi:alkanesulfonate monooxygenase SsuD/methylene tetrahydromethanopterin reductase-like flavin-dependent oxidoreductase (luciferase family)